MTPSTSAGTADDPSSTAAANKLMDVLLVFAKDHIPEVIAVLSNMQQSIFVLLVINCASAEETSIHIQEALTRIDILQNAAALLVFNQHPSVLEGHRKTMEAIMANPAELKMQQSVQDFSAEISEQQVDCREPVTLESLLSSSRSMALAADTAVPKLRLHLESLQQDLQAHGLSLEGVSDARLKAAFLFVGRDCLASWKEDRGKRHSTNIQYVNNCDPAMDASLTAVLGRMKHMVPGVCLYSNETAGAIAACMDDNTFGGDKTGKELVRLVGTLPSDCLWALIMLDPVHLARLMENSRVGIQWVSGVNTTTLIVSQAMTSTYRHREDYSLCSLNWLIHGFLKHWTLVCQDTEYLTEAWMKKHGIDPATPYLKCEMTSFVKAGVAPTDISMLMQPSGILVVTRAGASMHQTLSTGVSFAESGNSWMGYELASDALAANLAFLAQEEIDEMVLKKRYRNPSTGLTLARIYSKLELASE